MKTPKILWAIVLVALPLFLAGCGNGDGSPPIPPAGSDIVSSTDPKEDTQTDDTKTEPDFLTRIKVKNSEGKSLLASDGDGIVELNIPAGALPQDELIITISRVDDTDRPQNLSSNQIQAVYDLGPDGTQFKKDISVKITYPVSSESGKNLLGAGSSATLLTAEGNKNPVPLKNVAITQQNIAGTDKVVITGTTTHFSYLAVSFSGTGKSTGISGGFETVDPLKDIFSLKADVGKSISLKGTLTLDPNNAAYAWNMDALGLASNYDRFIVSNSSSLLSRTDSAAPVLPSVDNNNTFSQDIKFTCTGDGIVNLFLGFDLDVMLSKIDPLLGGTSQFKTLTAVVITCGQPLSGGGNNNNNNNNNNTGATPTDIVTCDLAGFNNNSSSSLFNSQPVEGVTYPSCTFPGDTGNQNQIPYKIDTSKVQFDDMVVLLPSNRIADGTLRSIPAPDYSSAHFPYVPDGNSGTIGGILPIVSAEPLGLQVALIDSFVDAVLAMNDKSTNSSIEVIVSKSLDKTRYNVTAHNVINLAGFNYQGTAVTEYTKPATTADAMVVKFDINLTRKTSGKTEALFGTFTQIANLTAIPTAPLPSARSLMESMLLSMDFSYITLTDKGSNLWETRAADLRCKTTVVNPPKDNGDGTFTKLEEYLKVGYTECSSATVGQDPDHKINLDVTQKCGGRTSWDSDCIKSATMCTDSGCPLHDGSLESGRTVYDLVGHFGVSTPAGQSGVSPFPTWEYYTLAGSYGRINTNSYDIAFTGYTSNATWFDVFGPEIVYRYQGPSNDENLGSDGWNISGEVGNGAPSAKYPTAIYEGGAINMINTYYRVYEDAYYNELFK